MLRNESVRPGDIAQTLDRGLQVLELLAGAEDGMSPTEVATRLDVHRSIAARLLATLLNRGFIARRRDGRYVLGTVLLSLARQVSSNLLVVATPLLTEVAERLGLTVVLTVADQEEAVAVASIEPKKAAFHLGIRPGSRHPLGVAAMGLAILSGRPPTATERPEVEQARRCGYAKTTGELVPNFTGLASPIRVNGWADASVSLVVPVGSARDEYTMANEVVALADTIAGSLT